MIDWKRRAMELAMVAIRHSKTKEREDRMKLYELAQAIKTDHDRERKKRDKFLEYWKCKDKKKAEKLYQEYLDLIREQQGVDYVRPGKA